MTGLILTASEAAVADDELVGGKSRGLTHLVGLGDVEVPPFVVVSSSAMVEHLDRAGLLRAVLLDEVPPAAVAEAITDAEVSPELREALRAARETLGDAPLAVRSSMVGEDSREFSFAGQLKSFLSVEDDDALEDALKGCWASAFSAHATAYRRRRARALGLAIDLPRVAVIVQTMVEGDVSGVAFTAHPVTGRRDHTLIHATWGLAEGVVSGRCNVDEFTVDADGQVETLIADKDLSIVSRGGSITEEITSEDRRHAACLSSEQARQLATAARRVADHLGAPQDIEWTLRGDDLVFLQTRPITALADPPNVDGPRVVFNNSNIQESYCGVTTPLTFSFAQAAYASVYEQTMRALRIPSDVIADHDDMLRNMLGLVRGRVYYNINNWYRGLLLLPSFGQNKEDMEAMMGLDVPVDFVEDQVLTTGEKLKRLPRVLRAFASLLLRFRSLPRDVPQFLADFDAAYQRVDRSRFPDASFSELMSILEQLRREMLENWSTPIINDFYVMMSMGRLRRLVEAAGVPNHQEVANNLLCGEEGIESIEPTRFLMRLSQQAQDHPDLVSLLQTDPAEESLRQVRREFPDFAASLDDYIERYGDRVIGELKLETVTAREDVTFVVRVLRNYLARPDLDPEHLSRTEQEIRAAAEAALFDRLSSLKRGKARKVIATARTAVKNRENLRLARTRMFGLYRDAYRAIGARLHEAGRLDAPRDIFYLTTEEVLAYHEGRAVTADFPPLVAARKAEFARYETQDLPHHFETVGPVYHGNAYAPPFEEAPAQTGDLLHGTGCYPGTVEAPLRVVMSPEDNLEMEGRILTTLRTDPGWAPLFPAAAGILVERGSTLSHSAVVARELGIPAVVGVPGLLKTVEDGEVVTLDGAAGTIRRHQAPDDISEGRAE